MSEAVILKELLQYWIEYADKKDSVSLKDFSRWLGHQVDQESVDRDTTDSTELSIKRMQVGHLFGELSNYADLWGKLAFKDLPIRRFEEYGLLKFVEEVGNPSKNDLANILVNEKSTAFEIIKRLIREGLFVDKIDKKDKRIRRVELTTAGRKVIEQADQQAYKVALILLGDATEEEIDFFLKKFGELNSFHEGLYNSDYDSIDDLLGK